MMKSISLIFFWIIVVNCVIICKADCDTGWFGSNCQYQCHCVDGCDVNGFCKTQKCLSRWFGYKCQYQDFLSSIYIPSGSANINTNIWIDQDDSTCVFDGSIKQMLVTLRYKSPFLFVRLAVGDSAVINKFTITLEDSYDNILKRYPCRKQTFTVTNNRTVDIRCDNTEPVDRVFIEGDGVTSLCSIYVNGGRNVALKQRTEQTSTNGTYYSSYAVDGTAGGNCTLTSNVTDVSPTWTLIFDEPMIVTWFEVTGDYPMRYYFYNSRLQTVEGNNATIYNYTTWSFYYLTTHNINSIPLKKVQIIATNNSFVSTPILSICEAAIYGACQPGKWDLDCKQLCDSKCPDFCGEWDGSCPTFCVGYQAPGCTVECSSEKWGINCMQDCSDRCQYKYCNSVDGLCTAGCNGYSDPPYCSKACVMGYYGLNCKSTCSPNCPNEECDQRNGNCIQTCGPNHQGPFSEETSGIEKNKDTFSFDGASFGIGIGVSVGVVVLVLVVVVVIVVKKRNNNDNSGVANTESTNMNQMRKCGETHGEPRADPNRYVQQPKSVTGPKDVLSTKVVHTKKALPPVPDDTSYEPIDMNQENESTYYNNHK